MARTIPTEVTLVDVPSLKTRLSKRVEKLERLLNDPGIHPDDIAKQRVLVFDTTCDLLTAKSKGGV
jgi:hypothetical protein